MAGPARSHMEHLSNLLEVDHFLIGRLGPTGGAVGEKSDTKTDYQIFEQIHVPSNKVGSLAVCSLDEPGLRRFGPDHQSGPTTCP
jgi:hypothetical protein